MNNNEQAPKPLFTLQSIKRAQDFSKDCAVKQKLVKVMVGKPNNQMFFRINDKEDYRTVTAVVVDKTERDTYLVEQNIEEEFAGQISYVTLYTGVTRQNGVFLWAIPLAGPNGKTNPWYETAHEAAQIAMTKWTRIQADMSVGCYAVFEALGNLSEPTWPEENFEQLVQIAFKDRYINTTDHPIIRRFRGEV